MARFALLLLALLSSRSALAMEAATSAQPADESAQLACQEYLSNPPRDGFWVCLGEADVLSMVGADDAELRPVWVVASLDDELRIAQQLFVDQVTREALYGLSYDGERPELARTLGVH